MCQTLNGALLLLIYFLLTQTLPSKSIYLLLRLKRVTKSPSGNGGMPIKKQLSRFKFANNIYSNGKLKFCELSLGNLLNSHSESLIQIFRKKKIVKRQKLPNIKFPTPFRGRKGVAVYRKRVLQKKEMQGVAHTEKEGSDFHVEILCLTKPVLLLSPFYR